MADNLTYTTTVATVPSGTIAATRLVTHAGDSANFQGIFPVYISGSEGAYTVNEVYFLEDSQHTSGDAGQMVLAVRNDTLGALAGTDGDYAPLQVNASGALFIQEGAAMDVSAANVTVVGTGTFAVQVDGNALTALQLIDDVIYVDDTATHTAATTKVAGVGVVAVPTDTTVEANDIAMPGMSTDRRLWVDAQIVGTDAALDVSAATVTVTGTVTANLGATDNAVLDAIQAAVEIMDDWDETNRAAVNTISGQVGVAGGSGVVGATTQRVVLATDVALPAGTNAIGKLAANSGVDIGDVDILSVIPGTGATNLGKAEDAGHTSADTGVYALAVRDTSPAAHSGTDGDYESFHISDDGGLWTSYVASHTGGYTPWSSIDLDETEEEVSATACTASGFYFWNATAAPLWVQLFNATAASVTVGTTAPTYNFPIPANADSDVAGLTFVAGPFEFSTALTIAVTTGSGTNAGAPGANEAGCFLGYKN